MHRTWLLTVALAGCGTPGGTVDLFGDAPDTPDPTTDPVAETPEVPDDVTTAFLDRSVSGEILGSPDQTRFWVADPDADALYTFHRETGQVFTTRLYGEPTRMVRADDLLFVTLRASGELVKLSLTDPERPVELGRVHVGAEPFDVVASGQSRTVVVSLSMEDAVVSLDADTLEVQDRWDVPGEPRWMAATSTGPVYVGSARSPVVTAVHPESALMVPQTHELPDVRRFRSADCHDRTFAKRLTGDLVLSADEQTVYAAGLYVDTFLVEPMLTFHTDSGLGGFDETGWWNGWDTGLPSLPGPNDGCPETGDNPEPVDPIDPSTVPYYAPPEPPETAARAGRFNPVMLRIPVTDPGSADVLAIGTTLTPPDGDAVAARGFPSSLVVESENGVDVTAWLTMPTMDTVVRLSLQSPSNDDAGNFSTVLREAIPIDARGARAIAVVPGDLELIGLWNFLDRRLDVARRDVASGGLGTTVGVRLMDAPGAELPLDVQRGRELFWSSTDARVVTPSSGAACVNCHADGRTDGLTWVFEDFPRQTPSLAGNVSETTPVTWLGGVETVVDEVHSTTRNRMGGTGLDTADAAAVAAYVEWTRHVRLPPQDAALVADGEQLFALAGCAGCHAGSAFTDGRTHGLPGLGIRDTPTLRGIAATAPYFHDGRASTLRNLLERSRDGSMGNTGGFTDAQMDALEAYLRTL